MKVESSAIKKFKSVSWFDKGKRKIVYGLDMVMEDGRVYHCHQGGYPLFYENKSEARKAAKKENEKLKAKESA